MKNFDWEEFKKGDIVVHCNTLEKNKDFLKNIDEQFIKYIAQYITNAYSLLHENIGYRYNKRLNMLYYANIDFYRDNGYKIIDWKIDYDTFTKSDLKYGMIVELRNGYLGLVMTDFIAFNDGYYNLQDINEDLTDNDSLTELDIVKVYELCGESCLNKIFDKDKLYLIWERKEIVYMTLKALNKNIKIKED